MAERYTYLMARTQQPQVTFQRSDDVGVLDVAFTDFGNSRGTITVKMTIAEAEQFEHAFKSADICCHFKSESWFDSKGAPR